MSRKAKCSLCKDTGLVDAFRDTIDITDYPGYLPERCPACIKGRNITAAELEEAIRNG